MRVEVLPASYGDCLLLTAHGRGRPFVMLVDTGPDIATLSTLRARLESLPVVSGRRRVDLFVITHIDADHIGNAAALLQDRDLGLEFGDIWFNGLEEVLSGTDRGVAQADEVSRTLRRLELPHNQAFGGGSVVVTGPGSSWREVPLTGAGAPRITLLSPGQKQLSRLAKVWPDAVRRCAAGEPDSPGIDAAVTRGVRLTRPPIDLAALASVPYQEDDSLPNASSIAFLVEHRGCRLLLTGDGISSVYGPSLAALLATRSPGERLLDVVKLSHHGSRRNTQAEVALFRAQTYLVSSSNRRYGLPDDETIARLVRSGTPGRVPTFAFNYATALNLRWREVAAASGDFEVAYPTGATTDHSEGDGKGIVLDLPSKA